MTMENKALGSKSPGLPLILLFKTRVKSNSHGTSKSFIVNGSIFDDPDIIHEQPSQHFEHCYNIEIETSIDMLWMLTSRHLSTIAFISTNIRQDIATLKMSYNGGPGNIPSLFVKYAGSESPWFCLKLINLSTNYGALQCLWKTPFIILNY